MAALEILDTLPERVHLFDSEWRFLYLNQSASAALGRPAEELIGKVCWEEYPAMVGTALHTEGLAAMQQSEPTEFEAFCPLRRSWFSYRVLPLRLEGRSAYSVRERDITPLKRAELVQKRLRSQHTAALIRQRRFLREIVCFRTQGRLRLCRESADLPEALPDSPNGSAPVLLRTETLAHLRRHVRRAVEKIGILPERAFDFSAAVSEAAMNAIVHAGGGMAEVRADAARGLVQVWVADNGRGITEDVLYAGVSERGTSTRGTLGQGLWLMIDLTERVYLKTGRRGTTVVLEVQATRG